LKAGAACRAATNVKERDPSPRPGRSPPAIGEAAGRELQLSFVSLSEDAMAQKRMALADSFGEAKRRRAGRNAVSAKLRRDACGHRSRAERMRQRLPGWMLLEFEMNSFIRFDEGEYLARIVNWSDSLPWIRCDEMRVREPRRLVPPFAERRQIVGFPGHVYGLSA
jgi:hypothetical protein